MKRFLYSGEDAHHECQAFERVYCHDATSEPTTWILDPTYPNRDRILFRHQGEIPVVRLTVAMSMRLPPLLQAQIRGEGSCCAEILPFD